ncbi:MAG TPA: hypothetical protein VK090_01330, partial [Paracoccaceae bacterium]|nr:hypothetical protein [Paracoccaceae bacterium]
MRLSWHVTVALVGLGLFLSVPGAFAQSLPAQAGGATAGAETGDQGEAEAASERAWFPVEHLNSGLPPPPEDLARETPLEAVESFLDATEAGQFDRAAHLLDLSRLDAGQQKAKAPALA